MKRYLFVPFLLSFTFLALFGLAEYLYRVRKIRAEITRKLVHVGTGLLTLLFPILLTDHWQVLFLCGSFLLLLLASWQYQWLPSINAIDRFSYGSLLFPVAVYGCYLAYAHANQGLIMFYLPVLTLAICDPLAALVGKRFPYGRFQIGKSRKTLSGSLAFFFSCAVLSLTLLFALLPNASPAWHTVVYSLVLAVCVTNVEAVSGSGLDNFTIPLSVIVILIVLL